MKKIVSIIFTFFVIALSVNAQNATIEYNKLSAAVTSNFGMSSIHVVGDSITVDISNNYQNYIIYGIRTSNGYLRIYNKPSETTTMNFSVTLNDDLINKGLCIKRLLIEVGNTGSLSRSTIANNSDRALLEEKVGYDYYYIRNTTNKAVTSISLSKVQTEDIYIKRIVVECGKFADNVTLNDGDAYPYLNQNVYAKNVTYTRQSSSKWGSLCLPFDFFVTNSFKAYRLTGITGTSLDLESIDNGITIKAGTPILYYVENGSLTVKANNVMLSTSAYDADGKSRYTVSTENSHIYIYGTIKKNSMYNGFFVSKDKFYHTSGNEVSIKPYRAWIAPEGEAALANLRGMSLSIDGLDEFEVTGIEENEYTEDNTVLDMYNINGVKESKLSKGLNIIKTANGVKKVYIK